MRLLHGDCLEELRKLPEKSVDLVLTDPPYNIHLAEWDTWKTQDKYIEFMLEVFKECERVLKDNGSLYWFHSDMEQAARLMEALRRFTSFSFNSFITLDKGDFRAQSWKYPTEENNLRSWFNTCEYCFYYNKMTGVSTAWDRTGWEKIHLDVNNFSTLRNYVREMLEYIGSGARADILATFGGCADHFLRYNSTQWALPVVETYDKIINKYNLRNWEKFREYEDLRREYEDLRYVHNLDPNHNNIFRFKRDNGENFHPCQKPLDILRRLIKCSTKENGVVLDCFMGSGSSGVAAVQTGRDFIGIERDDNYFDTSARRIYNAQGTEPPREILNNKYIPTGTQLAFNF